MAWIAIPNNPNWEYDNAPASPGANSPYRPLWAKQTAGIRTDGVNKIYTKVRKVGRSDASMGELSKTFWDAKSGGTVTRTAQGLTVALPASVDGTATHTVPVTFTASGAPKSQATTIVGRARKFFEP